MKTYRMTVQGMTCTGCEQHVARALSAVGAKLMDVSFRRGEAVFALPEDADVDMARQAVKNAHYEPGDIEEVAAPASPATAGEREYDYIIIGSGAAAFSSAIEAVKYGAKVAMVERGTVGGTCVNIGCVPSKTLLRAGEIQALAQNHPFLGLHTSAGPVDLALLVKQKNELVEQLRQAKYADLIREYGFDFIRGEARFVDGQTIEVNGQTLSAKRFLIATGASPAVPDIPGLHDVDYLTSTTLLELEKVPKRLAVIGAGYIGMELGQLFHHLGSEVTLMQRSSRLLKEYDPEISEAMTRALTEQGIRVITGASFERVEQDGNTKKVYVNVDGRTRVIEADELLVAAGRTPNTAALNLPAAGVEVGARGEILIDEYTRTTNPSIYAAGDVTLGPQFVYVAAYQGAVAAANAVGGLNKRWDTAVVPAVTFTHPAIATVGLTEQRAKENGYDVKTSVLPLEAVPRAIVNRETTGVFKLVAEARTGKLLGAHIVADHAGEVIYAAALAIQFGLTIDDLRRTLAPYLTMAEGLKLAALTFDQDVSKLSCCAG
ncbi:MULTISPECIES: mercury(II) reductase [Geobacillus]|uniref:Mercuric reductase n=1 Tax=Geobacillus thermoleovorans CCB_US3_UF5 TaxID=1111068 RepID=A0ABM5MLW7_GEOTH|nr:MULTISPECIES: mercury(II) reductase [Geobacillus]AEV20772.1 Mercuric reductase [Geobacillus thermoleovorans CCB_US3_UF5]EQB96894.1 mercuric reductase [Geobacillus sp. A8]MBW7642915.1 mercury(II) reductase [Geobacillus thermoleovorans]ODA17652.1 mercury(II) reductase [Geobacillus thermoleovorans]OQP14457.1 mercury(II) reductase [Geobacillus thermoleovorans]